ncbi:MAG: glycosyltransferase family 4 protein [Methylovulum sp.]|uniref:glycosyltransferase family 4 protein n=1 Tax=Methylovulum sp. TaxID=1916980 RepID=UPI00261E86ED|nr:glycosyltransferase family 4 protein [Methylovulum sp.]MDD2722697.1 glycosyltransferase family 4 protein [Methylovulum sp.]MDD5124236.1 glycosyltransferase family 4 protein [Methylovulum sp.]
MRILFIHNNFPAQYRHIAGALANNPDNKIGFITQNQTSGDMPGVTKLVFEPARKAHANTHLYVKPFENAVLEAQAVVRVLDQLKAKGFVPDVICAHTGWGSAMFVKDIFPQTPLLLYCEWFTRFQDSDLDFDPASPTSLDDILRFRASNAAMLVDLEACDGGVTPTHWQHSRFPPAFQPRIQVLHDGVDTEYFQPQANTKLQLPDVDLSGMQELVTYVSRGMDTYRGFPQFIEAIGHLLDRRPHCHAVIVAADRIAYGSKPPEGESWKAWMQAKVDLDWSRVHFTGSLPYKNYRQVLQASSVHVYLTKPFVLSWSLLEALSTGCLVVASDTAPVREVIKDNVNGLLVDFFDTRAIAKRIEAALDDRALGGVLRQNARETVLEHYALAKLLPRQLQLLDDLVRQAPFA